jgi:hypothetical protein
MCTPTFDAHQRSPGDRLSWHAFHAGVERFQLLLSESERLQHLVARDWCLTGSDHKVQGAASASWVLLQGGKSICRHRHVIKNAIIIVTCF